EYQGYRNKSRGVRRKRTSHKVEEQQNNCGIGGDEYDVGWVAPEKLKAQARINVWQGQQRPEPCSEDGRKRSHSQAGGQPAYGGRTKGGLKRHRRGLARHDRQL